MLECFGGVGVLRSLTGFGKKLLQSQAVAAWMALVPGTRRVNSPCNNDSCMANGVFVKEVHDGCES